jgi:hypothetical protein
MSRHRGRGSTGDAVFFTAASPAIILEAALYTRHVRGAAPPRAQPLVARAVVEALAIGLRAARRRALRLAAARRARDVGPEDVCVVEAIVLAARA